VLEEAMILKGRGWLRPENLALDAVVEGPGMAIGHVESGEPGHHLTGRQQVALELARTIGR
jgi:hypothetical protein